MTSTTRTPKAAQLATARVVLAPGLLALVDQAAAAAFTSRSEVLRRLVLAGLAVQPPGWADKPGI